MKWFKHMSDMSNDVKIRRVIRKYGAEGYGLYNYIIELIVRKLESNSPIPDLEETSHDIATDMNMDTVVVEEIMWFCIEQGLFEQDEFTGRLVAHKVYKFLDTAQTRNPEIKKMIAKYKEMSETVTDSHGLSLPEKKRIEKNRIEQTRKENSLLGEINLDEIIKHWNTYSPPLPEYRYLSPQLFNTEGIGQTAGAYSQEEIVKAVDNYASIVKDRTTYRAQPEYTGLSGFLAKGVEKYYDKAYPFDRCRIRTYQDAEAEKERERKERIRKKLNVGGES